MDGLVAAYAQRATHASMPAPPPSPALPVPRPPLGFMAQLRYATREQHRCFGVFAVYLSPDYCVCAHMNTLCFHRLLFRRAWQQVTRDKVNLTARAMSNISSALVFGSIFWRMGRAQSTIQDRMGLLQACALLVSHVLCWFPMCVVGFP